MQPLDLLKYQAATQRFTVLYTSKEGETEERDISVIAPCLFSNTRPGVYAYCFLRDDFRSFLIEKIKEARTSSEPMPDLRERMILALVGFGQGQENTLRAIRRYKAKGVDSCPYGMWP